MAFWHDLQKNTQKIPVNNFKKSSEQPVPHIKNGTLIIPWNSDPKYHWWNNGQPIEKTLNELNAPEEVKKRYC